MLVIATILDTTGMTYYATYKSTLTFMFKHLVVHDNGVAISYPTVVLSDSEDLLPDENDW